MKDTTRLTLIYSSNTAIVLLIFAIIIYKSAKKDREKEFYTFLKKEAYMAAKIFFNTGKVLHHYPQANVIIYDEGLNLLYQNEEDNLPKNSQVAYDFRLSKQKVKYRVALQYSFKKKSI